MSGGRLSCRAQGRSCASRSASWPPCAGRLETCRATDCMVVLVSAAHTRSATGRGARGRMSMVATGLITAEEAVRQIRTGDTVMVGGFGLVGAPLTLIDALVEHSDATDLTIDLEQHRRAGRRASASCCGRGGFDAGSRRTSPRIPRRSRRSMPARCEATLVPQGTFAEAIRAGGAGIGGFFTPVGAGNAARRGKGGAADRRRAARPGERRSGPTSRSCTPRAPTRSATSGTAAPRATSTRSWRPPRASRSPRRARSSRSGSSSRSRSMTPHLYVDELVVERVSGTRRSTHRGAGGAASCGRRDRQPRHRHPEPDPRASSDATPSVFLHTENGLLGVGPRPEEDELDPDLIDAAKRPMTALPGASYFDSAASFAMIRGGHVDVAVLGALQVSARGDIANWAVPGKDVLGVGGAMDLVVGARRVIVTMTATLLERASRRSCRECTLSADGAWRGRRRHHGARGLPLRGRRAHAHGAARRRHGRGRGCGHEPPFTIELEA